MPLTSLTRVLRVLQLVRQEAEHTRGVDLRHVEVVEPVRPAYPIPHPFVSINYDHSFIGPLEHHFDQLLPILRS